MRITAKIATAGKAGLSRFPVANSEIDDCLTEDGKLDEAKVMKALKCEQVQFSDGDDRRVYAFAIEYLRQQRSVVEHLAAKLGADEAQVSGDDDDGRAPHTEARTVADSKCERNMRRDRVAYVRTDVTARANDIRVRLDVQNPREQVGAAEQFARDYAVLCARCILWIVESVAAKHGGRSAITLVAGGGCPRVFEEAREMDALADRKKAADEANAMRMTCPHRRTRWCALALAERVARKCPCERNGACEAVSVEDEGGEE